MSKHRDDIVLQDIVNAAQLIIEKQVLTRSAIRLHEVGRLRRVPDWDSLNFLTC